MVNRQDGTVSSQNELFLKNDPFRIIDGTDKIPY